MMTTTTEDAVRRQLERFVVARLGAEAEPTVGHLSRIGVGRSRENWLFDANWTEGDESITESLIVRRDPLGGLIDTDRSIEFELLWALDGAVQAPIVRWLDPTGDELGRPALVMVRKPGDCDYYLLSDESRPVDERVGFARQFCELLADVHAIDWRAAGIGSIHDDPGPSAAHASLDQWEATLHLNQIEPYPELTLARRWLRAHAPTSPGTVLVHSDFKPGNILIENGHVTALLDWELAHLGDPHEDLGWITQPLRTREHYVEGVWGRDALLDHYEKVSGTTIDREAVAWWNAMSTYKTAVMQVTGLRAFIEGRSDQPYRPTGAVLSTLLELIGDR